MGRVPSSSQRQAMAGVPRHVMAQLAAEAIGMPRDRFRLVKADTALVPDSGIQGASGSTYWVGGAVAQAAKLLRRQILRVAAEMLDCHSDCRSLNGDAVISPDGVTRSLVDVATGMDRIGQPRRVQGVLAPRHASEVGLVRCVGERVGPSAGVLPRQSRLTGL
jgi:CO/xanthine dehydrogenase Mo-binding subunit